MLFGIPLHEFVWLLAAVIAAGLISGVLGGLFGVGGGAVIVPALYEVFRALGVPEDVRMQLCVGTSTAIIVPTVIRSFLVHRAKGLVIPGVIGLWSVPAVLGVAVSSVIAAFAPASVFTLAFVVIATFMAIKLIFAGDRWHLGDQLPGKAAMTVYGFLIGLGGSLMGVSGGGLSTIVLTLYRKPIHAAVATSTGVAVPITLAGSVGFVLAGLPHMKQLPPLSLGFVSLIGLVVMAPLASVVAPFGARLAHRMPRRWLSIAFGCFLQLVALRFVFSLIWR